MAGYIRHRTPPGGPKTTRSCSFRARVPTDLDGRPRWAGRRYTRNILSKVRKTQHDHAVELGDPRHAEVRRHRRSGTWRAEDSAIAFLSRRKAQVPGSLVEAHRLIVNLSDRLRAVTHDPHRHRCDRNSWRRRPWTLDIKGLSRLLSRKRGVHKRLLKVVDRYICNRAICCGRPRGAVHATHTSVSTQR